VELKYVENHTIFECVVGSQAYGISTPESDEDRAGVMIPGKEFFYGLQRFEQFQGFKEDKTIYDFRKAISLIADNNPNMIDLLCIPERCIVKNTKFWQEIMDNANLFISKKCRYTYQGYAYSQIKRIETHRAYILNPLKKKPERNEFGLKETSIFETSQLKALISIESLFNYVKEEDRETFLNELDTVYGDEVVPLFHKYLNPDRKNIVLDFLQTALQNQLNTFTSLGKKSYVKDEFVEEAEKELKYISSMKNWQRYEEWKKHRNKKRAILEEKFGMDCKHCAHCVRLINMSKEILQTGKVNVDRTNIDAVEIKAIRNGAWTFEQLKNYAEKFDNELNELYQKSILQKSPQTKKIDELCINIIDKYLNE
jgi:predicted nucleotidyltransferase